MGKHTNPSTGVEFEVDDSKDERYLSGDAAAKESASASKSASPASKKAAQK